MNAASPRDGDARRKGALAAILAVQRGLLDPDEAMQVLSEAQAHEAQPAAFVPAQSLLSIEPGAREAIERDAEQLAADPKLAAQTLASFGIAEATASTIAQSPTHEDLHKTLMSVAATRPAKKRTSARLAETREYSQRYKVVRELARGGMGRVLIAQDNAVGREVALKELLPSRGSSGGESAGMIERFLREAKVTGQLEHPNIVPVYEIGEREDGSVYYTMKLVQGRTLAQHLAEIAARASLSAAQKLAARLELIEPFVDVCDAVAYAHSRGVIHRDLKPANIMLGGFGETLVLDWGLARVRAQQENAEKAPAKFSESLLATDSQSQTLAGSVIGTPAYMPPEQAHGNLSEVDEKSDVYSLGAILFEIVSGAAPYEGATANQILSKVLSGPPVALREHERLAPRDLAALAANAMARDKSARLGSASAFGSELRAWLSGRPLSVYRYSAPQRARLFIGRNKLASAVAALAVLVLMVGATAAFFNIASERDEAQFQLQRAQREEANRIALEERQQAEHRQFLEKHLLAVNAQRSSLDGLEPGRVRSDAQARISRYSAATGAELTPAERAENSALISRLLEVIQAREELLRLLTEPAAGHALADADDVQLKEERAALLSDRLGAAKLAQLNGDFTLAEFVIRGSDLEPGRRVTLLDEVAQSRAAVLRRHAEAINAALADIRAELGRGNRPPRLPSLEEYATQLCGYREKQTVELLAAALEPFTLKARGVDPNRVWTAPERDEITLICRVLGALELPEACVPPLSRFMDVIDDDRLAVECGLALCSTASELAQQALLAARERFASRPLVWLQISRRYGRVPQPREHEEPSTADGFLARGKQRQERGDNKGAYADFSTAIELDASDARFWLARARVWVRGCDQAGDVKRALELNPNYAEAWLFQGTLRAWSNDFKGGKECASKAIELSPKLARAWSARGTCRSRIGELDEALADLNQALKLDSQSPHIYIQRAYVYVMRKDYERAAADCTLAIELDPRLNEAWINRSAARMEMNDLDGAISDATRMIELAPRHSYGYANRAHARRAKGDIDGAIYDWTKACQGAQGHESSFWVSLGDAWEAKGDLPKAIETWRTSLTKSNLSAEQRERVTAKIEAAEKKLPEGR